jgi:hypothetical protein
MGCKSSVLFTKHSNHVGEEEMLMYNSLSTKTLR